MREPIPVAIPKEFYYHEAAYVNKLRTTLLDCITLLETIHTRETTGRGPSYHTYYGQVNATIQEGKALLKKE